MSKKYTFGETLESLRTEQGISQTDLYLISGISQAAISQLERNRRSPTQEQTKILSGLFGVDMNQFLPLVIQSKDRVIDKVNQLNPKALEHVEMYLDFVITKGIK